MQRPRQWTKSAQLAALFFLHSMGLGMWFVPLTLVLGSHGLSWLTPYAFATSSIAAFVSPLIFGAMADRHVGPVRVLRWLATGTAISLALVSAAVEFRWNIALLLGLIQLLTLCVAPTSSITATIVLAEISDPKREFGPLRAMGTVGWIIGCWFISAIKADASTMSGFTASITWLALAGFTFTLPSVAPPKSLENLTVRQRLGLDALMLLKNRDHRAVFVTAGLAAIPLAAFYPFTPPHLRDLGFERTSAWMTLGQITEIFAMFALGALLARWRLKWVFAAGLACALVRYVFCAFDEKAWVLAGVSLHGFAYTLFFITAPIYLGERVDRAWRARAQALMSLMTSGVGSLLGYIGSGWWLGYCGSPSGVDWRLFWGGLAVVVAAVMIYFLATYRGQRGGLTRAAEA